MDVPGGLSVALVRDFGGVERWREQFIALAARGRALLLWSPEDARLVNRCVEDGRTVPAGAAPVFELGAGAASTAIDWEAIDERYRVVVAAHTHGLGVSAADLDLGRDAYDVLDVRRDVPFDAASDMIEGARRADPARLAEWAGRLDRRRKVVVYCVFGHEVGRSTAAALIKRGIDAHDLESGIEQWKLECRPVQPKGATQ